MKRRAEASEKWSALRARACGGWVPRSAGAPPGGWNRRIEVLIRHGGIYLDADTFCLRPFGDLRQHECVMARQGDRGLCNAVILAAPQAKFLMAWRETFRAFRSRGRDANWDEHAVRIPGRLARDPGLRDHIHVLDGKAFFYPTWHEMEALFESSDRSLFDESYCVHLWSTATRKRWLSRVTPEYVDTSESNFAFFARRHLAATKSE